MHADSCLWAIKNEIKLIGGSPFTLAGYEHIADIMRDPARKKAVMKGAQGGGTTLFMLDAIHGLIYNQYPQGVIYYFPTEKSVEGFSKTRFGPLVNDNPAIRQHLTSTKSVSIKKVGKTFLSLLGAKSTQSIQGKKDGTSVRSTPADYIIRDERDLFDDDMAEQTKQRILNSTIKKEVDLGTPTIPDFGIAKCYDDSDQKHWMIPCPACNEYTCLAEEFPNSVKFKKGKAYFACIKCGKEISPRNGKWVAKHPDRDISGYLISHLLNAHCDLDDVMARWEKCQIEGKIGEFRNSILGQPYIAAEDRLTISDVINCCGNDIMLSTCAQGTALGADIGKTDHVIIAQKKDKERARIIKICRVTGFPDIHDLAQRFNVKSAVIDLRPYEESFRKFQAEEPYKVFGCEYRDKMRTFMKEDEKDGVYVVSRTEMFDKTHAWVKNQQIEIPRQCDEVKEFAKQLCACAKVLEENEQGDRIYRYRKLGDDHYRNALNYLWLALLNLHDYEINPHPVHAGVQEEDDYDVLGYGL
jgi:hypothetical protein